MGKPPPNALQATPLEGGAPATSPYLLSASSAERLLRLEREARKMYVAGLNAQLAVGRVGLEAAGFERISARLNELALELSEVIEDAGQRAAKVVRRVHRVQMAQRCLTALEAAGQTIGAENHTLRRLSEEQAILDTALERLRTAFDTIEASLETADHLATGARVEAAKVASAEASSQIAGVVTGLSQSVANFRASLDTVRPALRGLASAGDRNH